MSRLEIFGDILIKWGYPPKSSTRNFPLYTILGSPYFWNPQMTRGTSSKPRFPWWIWPGSDVLLKDPTLPNFRHHVIENIGDVPKVAQEMIGQSWFVAIYSLIMCDPWPRHLVQVEWVVGTRWYACCVATIRVGPVTLTNPSQWVELPAYLFDSFEDAQSYHLLMLSDPPAGTVCGLIFCEVRCSTGLSRESAFVGMGQNSRLFTHWFLYFFGTMESTLPFFRDT